jgi:hypothetical protein
MATTTNYGWTTPDDTALVKDGAAAIRTLGSSIDTSLNTALGTKKAGMVLLNTTSFSGVASQALTADTFTSAYENYLIILNITAATADAIIYMKMRKSGTDSSASYYQGAPAYTVSGGLTNYNINNTTAGFFINEVDNGTSAHYYTTTLFLNAPKLNTVTTHTFNTISVGSGGTIYGGAGGGVHAVTDTYDSVNIIATAGNITGKVNVYGFNF